MASVAGRGAQVRLDGDDQAAARGALSKTMEGNSEAKRLLEFSGIAADGNAADGSAKGGVPATDEVLSTLGPKAPRVLLRSRRLLSPAMASFAAARTTHSIWALEGDFDLVRLIHENDTAADYTIDKASVAAVGQENAAGGRAAVDAAGSAVSWVPVTYNNLGVDGLPPSPAGSTASITVPAAVAAVAPKAYAVSDWMRVPSIPNIDGGPLRLLAVRSYSATATVASTIYATVITEFNPLLAQGRTVGAYHATGDFVAGGGTFGVANGILAPQGIQYYSRALGITVLSIGDSLTQGSQTSGNCNNYVHQACAALSRPGRPVSFVNGGWSGQADANYYLRGIKEIDLFRPQVVVISVCSPNDGATTQAGFDLMFSKAMDLAHYAMAKGAVPIIATASPFSTYGTTGDTFRKAINSRVLTLASLGGMLVVDGASAVTDGGSPQELPQVQYRGADGFHLNDAGHAAIAASFTPVLARAIR